MKTGFSKIGVLAILGTVALTATRGLESQESDLSKAILSGRVESSDGEPAVGIPVRAHLVGSNITVTVYSNKQGRYGYRELKPGSYNVKIAMAGFEAVEKEEVTIEERKPQELNFVLQTRRPSLRDLTTTEILLALLRLSSFALRFAEEA
jgi:hypothetical protein